MLSEAVTVLLWWAAAGIYHRRHPELTRFLLLDRSLEEVGIRISYDGREYDPFGLHAKGDMQYLGVDLIANMMRSVVYQRTFGVNTLQLLL